MCFGVCCIRQCWQLQINRTAHFMNNIDDRGHHFKGIKYLRYLCEASDFGHK